MDYKKLMDMTGKVCIVTGGTGYLGTENVKILKDFGATVVVADIRHDHRRAEVLENLHVFRAEIACAARHDADLPGHVHQLFVIHFALLDSYTYSCI